MSGLLAEVHFRSIHHSQLNLLVVSGSDKSENTEFYFRDFVNCLIISLFCSKNSVNSDEKSLPRVETTLSLIARLT